MNSSNLYIGVMSGTSLDGVDVALVRFQDHQPRLIAKLDYPMPLPLKRALLNVNTGQKTNLKTIGEIDHQLGHLYADAVIALLKQTGFDAHQIRAIGNHGQTVFHQPNGEMPFTLQLGDANLIAVRTSIQTIADFRRKDMALGGQGAPLVPAFHRHLFAQPDACTIVLNIGGIANISVLHPRHPVIGFDTGPGNLLMDAWCQRHLDQGYDKDAQWGQSGTIDTTLLTALLRDPYLTQDYPKSTGREHYNLSWLEHQASLAKIPPQNVQRTLCEFTAQTIADAIAPFHHSAKDRVLVCGGGTHNPLLMKRIRARLPSWQVEITSAHGVDADQMEAIAFAWLARCYIEQIPSNLPDVTGASRATSLGVSYLP
ncbi:anhydro-N-acetylmuramic acid kinase [Vibrio sp. SM6]|uniref:Anhydro-N-acetylmuramic acid kinase n=1 Tax=Vibrio agarilyticus TaxID=2726741 RepID=A0A7X8TP61_9VIBR|nr:anhydro-N-acetylmuramic acid kinase [Vibrio agarilyticus]NLS12229.1 anhydro-N-acetylmuramic acid kinase [Vibrio agarilyticus]